MSKFAAFYANWRVDQLGRFILAFYNVSLLSRYNYFKKAIRATEKCLIKEYVRWLQDKAFVKADNRSLQQPLSHRQSFVAD